MLRTAFVMGWTLALAGPALAQSTSVPAPPPPPPVAANVTVPLVASPPPPPAPRRWYGWQTLIPDAALVALVVADLQTHPSSGLPNRDAIPLGVFAFGVPAVHAHHHRWLHTAASIAGRIALPTLLGIANSVEHGEPDSRGVAWGVVGGMAVASALDALISWD